MKARFGLSGYANTDAVAKGETEPSAIESDKEEAENCFPNVVAAEEVSVSPTGSASSKGLHG
jgi:hypothetical protein